jgi:hypothetical protein
VCRQILKNEKESMQKQEYFHLFGHFLTIRCAVKLVFKISVPKAKKGQEPLL